jgi:hypothetical protein
MWQWHKTGACLRIGLRHGPYHEATLLQTLVDVTQVHGLGFVW